MHCANLKESVRKLTTRIVVIAMLCEMTMTTRLTLASAADVAAATGDGVRSDGQFMPHISPERFGGRLGQSQPADRKLNQPTKGSYRATTRSARPNSRTPAQAALASDVVNLDELVPIDTTPISAAPVRTAALTTDTVPYGEEIVQPIESQLPPGAREGVFQKMLFTATWAPQLSEDPDTIGATDVETGVVFGFPLMRRDTPLLVTPRFGVHFFDNAASLDLPSTVYDASVEFRHLRRLGDRFNDGGPWAMDVAATVGYYSDFEIDTSEALRVTGRGLAVYESSPATKWVLGVAYLNRAGATVLPVGGVIYAPTSDVSWELVFPRPRVAWQTADSRPGDESWWYVGGEFGGGIWAVERRSTATLDVVSYNDLRVMFGYERTIVSGINRRYEFGYVFDREIDYESSTPDVSLDDTLFVRAGVTY